MAFKILDTLPDNVKLSQTQPQGGQGPKHQEQAAKQESRVGNKAAAVKEKVVKPVQVSIDGVRTGPDLGEVEDQPADWGGIVGLSQAHVVNDTNDVNDDDDHDNSALGENC